MDDGRSKVCSPGALECFGRDRSVRIEVEKIKVSPADIERARARNFQFSYFAPIWQASSKTRCASAYRPAAPRAKPKCGLAKVEAQVSMSPAFDSKPRVTASEMRPHQ